MSTTRRFASTSAPSTGAEVVSLPTQPEPEPTPEEVEAAKARAAERDLPGWVNWLARPEKKIAIIGFTGSNQLAPWGQPGWEIWICNNLWKFVPDQWHRVYDLHDDKTITGDAEHVAFLSGVESKKMDGTAVRLGTRPAVVWKQQAGWPTSRAFPKDAIVEAFGRYFTNSISWMIAQAIYEGATDIHVYGVDMAQGSEYAAQRPSCEYFLGLAAGRGINVYIPPTSDLLKVSAMYGIEDDSALRIKLDERAKELEQRLQQLQGQYNMIEKQIHQVLGARENTSYFRSVWVNAAAARDGSRKDDSAKDAAKIEV